MKWTDANGVTKDIRDLDTYHLENILAMLKRDDGKTVYYGGGVDVDDMWHEEWYDEETIDNTSKIEKVELELRLRKLEETKPEF